MIEHEVERSAPEVQQDPVCVQGWRGRQGAGSASRHGPHKTGEEQAEGERKPGGF
jgi:hypothetical protein